MGSGTNGPVYELAASGTNLFAGGWFSAAGHKVAGNAAWANLGAASRSFAHWAADCGLSDPAAAAGADADRDGMQNGAEYVPGGNPGLADSTVQPTVIARGGSLIFTFMRNDASETGDVAHRFCDGTNHRCLQPGGCVIMPNRVTIPAVTNTAHVAPPLHHSQAAA
jgi:hypothetical protein